jgi:hypothetical protein
MRLCTILPLIFLSAAVISKADVITNLTFLSPSTIQAGGTVTVDFGVTFNPLPGNIGSTEFIDNNTANQVSSCASDPNPCSEIQILDTASTLSSVFAEAFGVNTPSGIPNFYPETSTGNFQPEPASFAMLGAGLVLIGSRRRPFFTFLRKRK